MMSIPHPKSHNSPPPPALAPIAPSPSLMSNPDVIAEPDEVMPPVPPPSFEMVVLGSGGGPLETDCSG